MVLHELICFSLKFSSCNSSRVFSSLSFDVTNRAKPCVHVVLPTQKLPTDAGIMPHDESSS